MTSAGRSIGGAAAAAIRVKSATSKSTPLIASGPDPDNVEKKVTRKRGRPKANVDGDNAVDAIDDGTSPYFNSNAPAAATATAPPKPKKSAPSKPKKLKLKPATGARLGKDFFDQDTVTLAKAMLGKVLCRRLPDTGEVLKGTVVETEAYTGAGDRASHSSKGVPTPKSMPMFMDPGTAYVYFTYGMYFCFNVSSNDTGGVVLVRALEVHEDYEIMQDLRKPKKKKSAESGNDNPTPEKPKTYKRHELANGPSKICLSFNINKELCNEIDMITSDDLWLETSKNDHYFKQLFEMDISRRVGIDNTPVEARFQPYRFFVKDNKSVSKARFKDDTTPTPTKVGRKSKK